MAQIQELFVDGIGRMHFVGGMIHLEFMRYIPVADGKAPLQQCTFCLIMPMHGFLDSINSMQDLVMRLLDFGIFHKESAYPPLRLLKNDPEEDNADEVKNDDRNQNQQNIQNASIKQDEKDRNQNQTDIKQNKDIIETKPIIEEKNILKMPTPQHNIEQKNSSNTELNSQNLQKQEVSQKQEEKLIEEKSIVEQKILQHNAEQKDSSNTEPNSQNVQKQSTNNEEIHPKDKKSKGLFGWLKKK